MTHPRVEPLESRIAPAALATLHLSKAINVNGFAIEAKPGGYVEFSASGGDFNGDGFGDLLVTGGSTYVVFGKADNLGTPVDLSALDGSDGFEIAGVSVAGDVFNARILAGYGAGNTPANSDAGIGPISIGGYWQASSIAAGVQDTSIPGDLTSAPDGLGQHDTLIAGDTTPNVFATIASITFRHPVAGSPHLGDSFGITAQRLLQITIAKTTTQFVNGTSDELLLDAAGGGFRAVDFA